MRTSVATSLLFQLYQTVSQSPRRADVPQLLTATLPFLAKSNTHRQTQKIYTTAQYGFWPTCESTSERFLNLRNYTEVSGPTDDLEGATEKNLCFTPYPSRCTEGPTRLTNTDT